MGSMIPPGGAFSCSKLQTCAASDLPDLPASKIDEGTFNVARIPDMDADKIESGTLGVARVPDLDAEKITSGTFDSERIPGIAGIGGTAAIVFVMDGGGAAIESGEGCFLEMPFDATIKEWRLLAGTVGSIAVDVWMDTWANFPPTDADSMPGAGNEPTISAANKAEETDLSAWTETSLSKGDILEFNIDSCGTITRCTLSMLIRKE